jgi:hypothetical protein
MIIEGFSNYGGQHCESSTTGALLKHLGLDLSEAMIVGLGESFGFIVWKMSILPLPFIGGRSKQFELTTVLCENLGLTLDARETASKTKAWANLQEQIDLGHPVGLQLDCFHLEYFSVPFHFPGHFVAAYGYDDEHVFLLDGGEFHQTSRQRLEWARFEKGSMSAKARSWTITLPNEAIDIKSVIPKAVRSVANQFVNPPIGAFGHKGIHKMADDLLHWLDLTDHPEQDIFDIADLMENGGTGGALFRNLYRDFLGECTGYYPKAESLRAAAEIYGKVAPMWTEVSRLLKKAGQTLDRTCLAEASRLSHQIAALEYDAMQMLATMEWD